MTQNRSSAVMQQRAASVVETDSELHALWRRLDFFPTPPWAARACGELIKQLDPEAVSVWEPAYGQGHFAEPLREYFTRVFGSDIHAYGRVDACTHDFLKDYENHEPAVDWIATNPPFRLAADFIRTGLKLANRGVLVLCRIALLESVDRYKLFTDADNPLTHVVQFSERVPMQLGSWDPSLSTATAYAAFVFQKDRSTAQRTLGFFPPGTRARLTRDDDVRRFAGKTPAPLLEGCG